MGQVAKKKPTPKSPPQNYEAISQETSNQGSQESTFVFMGSSSPEFLIGPVDRAACFAASPKLGADIVDRAAILASLQAANPTARASDVAMYADAFVDYRTAQLNITANGSIVFHPRTGAPIDNPYIGVRDRAGVLLRKIRLNTESLW